MNPLSYTVSFLQKMYSPTSSKALIEVVLLNFINYPDKASLETRDFQRFATATLNLMPPGFHRSLFWHLNFTMDTLPKHSQVPMSLEKMRRFLALPKERVLTELNENKDQLEKEHNKYSEMANTFKGKVEHFTKQLNNMS